MCKVRSVEYLRDFESKLMCRRGFGRKGQKRGRERNGQRNIWRTKPTRGTCKDPLIADSG